MTYIINTLDNLIHQTAFLSLTWGNYLMILVAFVFLYLAIAKDFEPLLLVPIAFGMLLVNIYPDIMSKPADGSPGGLLYYFFTLDEWAILPSLIFMGVGAMTDFGPLIANPMSFLLGAAAQFGIFSAYFGAIALGFNGKAAAAISIIGGADGASTAKPRPRSPSSAVPTALPRSSSAPSWDRQNFSDPSLSPPTPICPLSRSFSRPSCAR